jgi:hypothetical protein
MLSSTNQLLLDAVNAVNALTEEVANRQQTASSSLSTGVLQALTPEQRATANANLGTMAPLAAVPSAAQVDLDAEGVARILITGTAAIESFGTAPNGLTREIRFSASLELAHGPNLILIGAQNIKTQAGDTACVESLGGGVWRMVSYARASGDALSVPTDVVVDALESMTAPQIAGIKDLLGISDAGGSTPTLTHSLRQDLRTMTPGVDGPKSVIVEGLGVFVYYEGSSQLDDDETCFATATGRWVLEAASPDFLQAEIIDLQVRASTLEENKFFRGSFAMSMTSLSSLSSIDFTVAVPGSTPGDSVIVTPGNAFGNSAADRSALSFAAHVSSNDTITVSIRNASSGTAAVTASTWAVMVIKQK